MKVFKEITHNEVKQLNSLYYSLKFLHIEKELDGKREILNAVKAQSIQIYYIDFSLFYACVIKGLLFAQVLKELKFKCIED